MKRISVAAFAALSLMECFAADPAFSRAGYWDVPDSPRHVSSINTRWEFSLDEFKTVRKVNLPHSIDEGEIGFSASGGVNRRQPAWYRRVLSWKGGSARQFLHFEAIMGKCRIAVNGQKVAEHFGGYLPVHAEVTGALRAGSNTIEVWCDNSDDESYPPGKPQDQLDFTYFGGIYRDAYLVETADAYVTDTDKGGVYVTTKLDESGVWTVNADVTLGGDVQGAVTRFAYDGKAVELPLKLTDPATWTPETPNLHLLRVDVEKSGRVVDSVGVKFGIRDFSIDMQGLVLNGKRREKKLIGVNRHQDYLFIGNALPNSLHWRDVKKYKDCGMDIFRCAHYPQDPAFMDACDALGMFVIVATPGWQFWPEGDSVFEQRVYDDIQKMVRRDRSRPSVFMWEPILNETHFPGSFTTNAVAIVKREARMPNYCACDAMSAGSDACDVNYGWSSKSQCPPSRPTFCREWGDYPDDWSAQNSSSRVAMEWGERAMVAQAWHYMYESPWPSLASQMAAPAHQVGGTLWHGADHARGGHPENFYGGILTYCRRKKYAWHAFKAALTESPYVFVAHEFAPYSPAEIPVYSNCPYTATWLGKPFVPGKTEFVYSEEQTLTYNGGHVVHPRWKDAVFRVRLPDGTEHVRGRSKRFRKMVLEADFDGLAPVADGSDLVAVTAVMADNEGIPKRYIREKVRFEVEGPAEIVGENPQETRWGEATVLIRMHELAAPEPITVRAGLVRQGKYVRQNGYVTFTPGSLSVRQGTVPFDDGRKMHDAVERQQLEFNFQGM